MVGNPLELSYFRVAIDTSALTGTATTGDGAVDNTTPEEYGATSGFPATQDLSFDKERGNMRWEECLIHCSEVIQPVFVSAIVNTAGDEDTEPTQFDFTVAYDRPEFLSTADEVSPPTILTGAAAIKRFIERALITTRIANRNVFDPTLVASLPANQTQIVSITMGPAHDAAVTNGVLTAAIAAVVVTEITNITPSET